MIRKTVISVVLIVIVLATAGAVSRMLVESAPTPERKPIQSIAPRVQTVEVRLETLRDEITGHGTARADRAVILRAEVAAPIQRLVPQRVGDSDETVPLEEGVAVAYDALLIELDDHEFEQELERARQQVAAADARIAELAIREDNLHKLVEIASGEERIAHDEVNRMSGLFELNQANKREYDLARRTWLRTDRELQDLKSQLAGIVPLRAQEEATKQARQADIRIAELNIERCRITAPFAGSIDRLDVEMGQAVQRGTELLRIVALDRVEVPVELPVSSRPHVREQARCRLQMESLRDVSWVGRIARLSPTADERSRTYRAYVEVDNTRQPVPLLPGYFVKGTVAGELIEDALLVPRVAILEDTRVFVRNDSHAHTRRIEVVRYVKDRAVVRGDLKPGDRVITTHLDKLAEGMVVETDESPTSMRSST